MFDCYDIETEPVIDVSDMYGKAAHKHLVDICIVTFSDQIYKWTIQNLHAKKIAHVGGCNGGFDIMGFEYKEKKIAIYLSPLGSAMAGDNVIESSYLIGATKYIMFGSAGNLNREATEGRYVIPTQSYRAEGLSHHYMPSGPGLEYIDIKYCDKLASIFDELNVPYVKGRVWTTDSIFRETRGLVAKRQAEGCLAVDMELAGVQAVCTFLGYELYDFLQVGDVLDSSEWSRGDLSNANHNMDKLFIALEVAMRI